MLKEQGDTRTGTSHPKEDAKLEIKKKDSNNENIDGLKQKSLTTLREKPGGWIRENNVTMSEEGICE